MDSDYLTCFHPSSAPSSAPPDATYSTVLTNAAGHTVAAVIARPLEWDTAVFQAPVARVERLYARTTSEMPALVDAFRTVLARMDSDGVALCDIRINLAETALLHLAEGFGFRVVDVLNIYRSNAPKEAPAVISPPGQGGAWRLTRPEILDAGRCSQLQTIAHTAFRYSRVWADPEIDRRRAEAFHSRLLRSVVTRTSARIGLATDSGGSAIGFYVGMGAGPDAGETGVLWLLAVSPAWTGRGVGSALLDDFLAAMHQTWPTVEIGTQVNNHAANALYQRRGLRVSANTVSLHRWRVDG